MKLPGPAAVWQSDSCLVSGFRIPKNLRSWLHLSLFCSQFFLCKSEVIKDSHLGIFGYRSPCIPSVLVIISETTVQKRLCGQNTDALEVLKHYIHLKKSLVGGWATHLKTMSQIGLYPQTSKDEHPKTLWNHQLNKRSISTIRSVLDLFPTLGKGQNRFLCPKWAFKCQLCILHDCHL